MPKKHFDTEDIARAVIAQMASEDENQRHQAFMPSRGGENNPAPPPTMNPKTLQAIGAAADAGSTYIGMKRGGRETNPLVANRSPAVTALGAAGGGMLARMLTTVIARKYPRVAGALNANLGAEQLAAAVGNVTGVDDSAEDYAQTMRRSASEQQRRK